MRGEPRARTPEDRIPLKLTKPKTKAAGIPAVTSSVLHGLKKMGVVKTARTLRMVNQKEGFDCPGCAWPDPEHRTSFEFCENGAKAVADEAMIANVNPEFFAKPEKTLKKSSFFLLSKPFQFFSKNAEISSENFNFTRFSKIIDSQKSHS